MMDFKKKFIDDAIDLLKDLEKNLLKLENDTNNSMLIEEIFRAMHTLKGTAGMYGFEKVGSLTHRFENLFDLIRNGRLPIEKKILDLTLKIVDFLNQIFKSDNQKKYNKEYNFYNNEIENILKQVGDNTFDGDKQELKKLSKQTKGMQTWFISIVPVDDLRKRGIKMHAIFDEISEVGQNHIFNRMQKNKTSGSDISWEIILATEQSEEDIEDILLFIDDISEIHHLCEGNIFNFNFFPPKIESLAKQKNINKQELIQLIEDELSKEDKTNLDTLIESKKNENIKVSADKLDEQMNLLSELVTTKAEIQLMVEKHGYRHLHKASEQLEKITRSFRNNIFKIRLIPLESLQVRFDRLIRDLSKQLNKEVDFISKGMETELDKTIIDDLESPIMHLIRNCIDHGIETPDIRSMKKKSKAGTICFKAKQTAGYVVIEISDDGDGIDIEKIKKKAIEKKIISKNDDLDEKQIFDLIFAAGFSTAESLTEVSGRGVGMDVVKKTISNLRGTIDVKSTKGEGTKFLIKLPLTLSIIDTMLVRSGYMLYSIPLSSIYKCTEIYKNQLNDYDNKHVIIDKKLYPYRILNKQLKVKNKLLISKESKKEDSKKYKIVIVNNATSKTALIVDEVIGEQQAVLKQISAYFKEQQYISGATLLPDGQISLVLDINRLLSIKKY